MCIALRIRNRGLIPGSFDFTAARPALRPTQPPVQCASEALSPGIKWPGREGDHSVPSSTEAKNGGAIPSLPNMSLWHSA
jgi:hypothetical protein